MEMETLLMKELGKHGVFSVFVPSDGNRPAFVLLPHSHTLFVARKSTILAYKIQPRFRTNGYLESYFERDWPGWRYFYAVFFVKRKAWKFYSTPGHVSFQLYYLEFGSGREIGELLEMLEMRAKVFRPASMYIGYGSPEGEEVK